MSKWYVLWVLTGRERIVVDELKNQFTDEAIKPFIPKWESLFKRTGKVKKELNILFPGYVFIESDLETEEFRQSILQVIRISKSIIRILNYGSSNEIAIREDEISVLRRYCNEEHFIESSIGFVKGEHVYIESGPLVGMEGMIKEINRKKLEASFEVEFMGAIRRIAVGLELLRKNN